jgi:hypothetical protein
MSGSTGGSEFSGEALLFLGGAGKAQDEGDADTDEEEDVEDIFPVNGDDAVGPENEAGFAMGATGPVNGLANGLGADADAGENDGQQQEACIAAAVSQGKKKAGDEEDEDDNSGEGPHHGPVGKGKDAVEAEVGNDSPKNVEQEDATQQPVTPGTEESPEKQIFSEVKRQVEELPVRYARDAALMNLDGAGERK